MTSKSFRNVDIQTDINVYVHMYKSKNFASHNLGDIGLFLGDPLELKITGPYRPCLDQRRSDSKYISTLIYIYSEKSVCFLVI